MRALVTTVTATCVCALVLGCTSTPKRAERGPLEISPDLHRESDPSLSKHDRELIGAARYHLERSEKHSVDAYFQIRRTPEGYRILVDPVMGYDRDGPTFVFGKDQTVFLREDGTLIRIEGGL